MSLKWISIMEHIVLDNVYLLRFSPPKLDDHVEFTFSKVLLSNLHDFILSPKTE